MKNEVSFVFKLFMCGSAMNNVILCLFPIVFILCYVEQCVLWCLLSIMFLCNVYDTHVAFNFHMFVYHCSRIFPSLIL